MSSENFLKWIKEFIKDKDILSDVDILEIYEALDSIDLNSEMFEITKIGLPFAGTTITYPQTVWVSTSTYPDSIIKNPYTNENVD